MTRNGGAVGRNKRSALRRFNRLTAKNAGKARYKSATIGRRMGRDFALLSHRKAQCATLIAPYGPSAIPIASAILRLSNLDQAGTDAGRKCSPLASAPSL